jgi:hypothetical protein
MQSIWLSQAVAVADTTTVAVVVQVAIEHLFLVLLRVQIHLLNPQLL